MEAVLTPGHFFESRKAVHDTFGGQRQGGISVSLTHRTVLLFSNSSGKKHGYHDHWSKDGSAFFYYGSGAIGEMELVRGNKAIFEHLEDTRELHLFETTDSNQIKYVDQFCFDEVVNEQEEPINQLDQPQTLVFRLKRATEMYGPDVGEQWVHDATAENLASLRQKALSVAPGAAMERAVKRNIWKRSQPVRAYCLSQAQGQCEGCNEPAPFRQVGGIPYLEVHHIGRLSDGGPDKIHNVVAICPNCHRRAHHSEDRHSFTEHLRAVAFSREMRMEEKLKVKKSKILPL